MLLALQGIHWRKADRPGPPLPLIPGLAQSTGFHALSDLAEPWQHLDYAFLSPIYNSISKQGYQATAFPKQQLMQALAACGMPVYALGGVTPEVCSDLQAAGFDGCAVIGSVWSAPDPVEAYLRLEEACQSTGKV
jgi:thiamine-phosphate pyrophosphorylase